MLGVTITACRLVSATYGTRGGSIAVVGASIGAIQLVGHQGTLP